MGAIKRLFKWFKKPDLREKIEAAYGTDFVENVYDKMNEGIAVGNFVETAIYLDMIERVRKGQDG